MALPLVCTTCQTSLPTSSAKLPLVHRVAEEAAKSPEAAVKQASVARKKLDAERQDLEECAFSALNPADTLPALWHVKVVFPTPLAVVAETMWH